jgi:uncharacterized protein (TIGR00369 family)
MENQAVDQSLTDMIRGEMPFAGELELEIVSGAADRVEGRAQWRPERCTAGGVLHGGYLMGLADSVGAMCAVYNLPEGTATSTIESKTNFFRAVSEGQVRLTATPIHVGRSTIVVQTDLHRTDGQLVSRTIQTQAVIAG